MSRPEQIAPPEFFYNAEESAKYGGNSRMIEIQTRMTERALELAQLEKNSAKTVLDIGCGSGLSGAVLSEHGHYWVGMDISPSMLLVALERDVEGDLMLHDMGQGFRFRPGSFDAAVSISAVQWLCNRDKSGFKPFNRALAFFQSLFNALVRGGKAVLQFYPDGADQIELLTSAAMKAGFTGGLVVDFPHSAKAKKYFLVLHAGVEIRSKSLESLAKTGEPTDEVDDDRIRVEQREKTVQKRGKKNKFSQVKSKDWIHKKKDQMRAKGREVAKDSKFTGRKRKPKF